MPEARSGLTRRTFLATSAAAAGAAFWAGPVSASTRESQLRVGCIGLGRRGLDLVQRCAGLNGARLTAVYDARSTRSTEAAEILGARACRSIEEVLHHSDAVIIATPDHLHGGQTLAALQAGRHVYVEAPLSLNLEEARQIAALADDMRLTVQTGIAACSEPRWRKLQEICAAETIGTIRMAQYHAPISTRGLSGGTQAPASPHEVDWHAFDTSGSAFDARRLTHWRSYAKYCQGPAAALQLEGLALMATVLGMPRAKIVSASGGTFAHELQPQFDALMSTVDLESGSSLHVTASPLAGGQAPVLRGSRGSARLEGQRIRMMVDGRSEEIPVAPSSSSAHLENWIAAIRTGGACICPPRVMVYAQELVDLSLRAASAGKALRV